MTELRRGENLVLESPEGTGTRRLLVGVAWENIEPDIDLCSLMCGKDKKVLTDSHFLFWDQMDSPTGDAFIRAAHPGSASDVEHRAQLLVNLEAQQSAVTNIFVSLSTIAPNTTLQAMGRTRVTVIDLADGNVVATYEPIIQPEATTCSILCEIYRHRDSWKIRMIDQYYESGLAGLGRDYGVDIS